MLLSKAWEKFVVDPHRFRTTISRTTPQFPQRVEADPDNSLAMSPHRPIHICYLIHYFFPDKTGGTERFVLNLAKEQQRLGHRVHILTLGKRPLSAYHQSVGGIIYEEFDFEEVPVIQLRYRRAPRGLYYDEINDEEPQMKSFAEALLDRFRFDVIHAAYAQPYATFLRVCRHRGIPYLITATDFNIMCHYATLVSKSGEFCAGSLRGRKCGQTCKTYGLRTPVLRYQKAKALLTGACRVTVPSEFVARVLAQEFEGLFIEVVPHGISSIFSPGPERHTTRRFAYVGTLSNLKGVHLLIGAFQKMDGEAFSLDIYGDGEAGYVSRLKSQAKRDKRIHFHANVPSAEIARMYRECDCVIVSSLWFETYNFVLREALASGCLGIASNIGAMPEAVDVGQNGYLFPVGDEDALAAALRQAAAFPWETYVSRAFPCMEDEGTTYERFYLTAIGGECDHAQN